MILWVVGFSNIKVKLSTMLAFRKVSLLGKNVEGGKKNSIPPDDYVRLA